jgi:hypothetical protein
MVDTKPSKLRVAGSSPAAPTRTPFASSPPQFVVRAGELFRTSAPCRFWPAFDQIAEPAASVLHVFAPESIWRGSHLWSIRTFLASTLPFKNDSGPHERS